MFVCNGFRFENEDEAIRYAEFYRGLTGIFLGIEREELE